MEARKFFPVFCSIVLFLIVSGMVAEGSAPGEGERVEIFKEIWGIVHDRYPLFAEKGVDWEEVYQEYLPQVQGAEDGEQFYGLLGAMFRELRDGHTQITSTPLEREPRGIVPLPLLEIHGQIYVSELSEESPLYEKGVRPGMELVAVDGMPVDERIERFKEQLYWSTPHGGRYNAIQLLTFGLLSEKAELKFLPELTVLAQREVSQGETEFWYELLPNGIGYLRIPSWSSGIQPLQQFEKALEELKDTKALILDSRGNPGGDDRLASRAAGRLLQERTLFTSFRQKFVTFGFGWLTPSIPRYVRPRGDWQYEGHLVILIDEGINSSGEFFVQGLQASQRATTVGRITAGSSGNPKSYTVADIGFRVSTWIEYDAQGELVEGRGIEPHIFVEGDVELLALGKDPFLEKALTYLEDKLLGD